MNAIQGNGQAMSYLIEVRGLKHKRIKTWQQLNQSYLIEVRGLKLGQSETYKNLAPSYLIEVRGLKPI